MVYDTIIIGSGPAGYAASIYTSRAFLKTLLVAGIQPGGQLTTTTEIENFPGFPKGINGPHLMTEMKAQTERFGTEIVYELVSSVKPREDYKDKAKNVFRIQAGEHTYYGRSVIIATGASAKRLGLASEEKFNGKGISYCATCDGFFFRGKEIMVIGGGDTAMEEATFLIRFASKVTIVHRRDTFRSSPIMLEKAKKNEKIAFLVNKEPIEFIGETVLTGIKLRDAKTGSIEVYPTQGVFVAIGHKPNTDFLKGTLELDEHGYILIKPASSSKSPHTQTSVTGIFAAGDCTDPHYRQAIIAAGTGVMAALDVQKWLEG